MLKIYDVGKKSIGLFEGYDAFLGFITSLENQKLLEGHLSFEKDYCAFAEYTPEEFRDVCAWIKPCSLTTPQTKALAQKQGLIEICPGSSSALQEIPVTPDLDIKELKKGFCLEYCVHHEWRLIETQGHTMPRSVFAQEGNNLVSPFTRKMHLSQKSLGNARIRRLKAELDCCISRLQHPYVAEKLTPAQTFPQKEEF